MNCIICGCTEWSFVFNVGAHRLVKCPSCGLLFTADYSAEETSYIEDDYFISKNQYVARWDELCSGFELLADKIMRFKQHGRFLDIGASIGALMHVVSKRGFEVKGVEVSKWASEFARKEKGLDVATGKLDDAFFESETFDVVVVNHVLEHIDDPVSMLTIIRNILKNNGLLVVGVPNSNSIMAKLRGPKWQSLRPEEHIWHFAPSTLRRLISNVGFNELYFEAKDNYPIRNHGVKGIFLNCINRVAVVSNRSEAMLSFSTKK